MHDYLTIGPVPANEECAQLGSENYEVRAKRECARFISLIRKRLGQEPQGARLAIKGFNHDFGRYYEVVCYYEDEDETATEYAFRCESDAPQNWDPEEAPEK